MLILGIDPGSRFTGWGLIEQDRNRQTYRASGVLRLNAANPLPQRLLSLSVELDALLARYQPEQCAVEQIFTARNARSALVLGHARGVALCAVARQGISLYEYTPSQIKQAVVGQGRATKAQIQHMVPMLLGVRAGFQEDEADALAVALAHAAASRFLRSVPLTSSQP